MQRVVFSRTSQFLRLTGGKLKNSEVKAKIVCCFPTEAPLHTSREVLSLTFFPHFVFFQGFYFLSNLAELLVEFKKQRFDLLVRSCVKIVGIYTL